MFSMNARAIIDRPSAPEEGEELGPEAAENSASPDAEPAADLAPDPADVFAHWRGTALQYFAGAEFSVAEALATGMARGEVIHVPADTEDRFGALGALVGEGSVWKDKGRRLREALADFEGFLPLRRALVNGLARIETLSGGGFVVRLALIDPYGRSGRETLFHDELESQLVQLREVTRTLRDTIRIQLASLPPVVEEGD